MPEPPFQNQHPANPQTHNVGVGENLTITDSARAAVLSAGSQRATLSTSSIIIPDRQTGEGVLIRDTSLVWNEIVQALGEDWSIAYQIPPERWEEIVAGAFRKAKYDEVVLT